MQNKMKVKNSGVVTIKSINDYPDGNILIAESQRDIPFKVKRFYVINELHYKNSIRGKHAHKKLEQVIFCIHGSFTLTLDDGKNKQKFIMNDPTVGIKLGKLLWTTMTQFSRDCIILVIADDYYKENDYIRNYTDFLACVKRARL